MTADIQKLPPLPAPYTVASTIKCTACGAPYEPMRALAPHAAAGFGGRLMSSGVCKCGNSQFGGTVSSYDSLSPAIYTAEQMRAYALAAIAADRAARPIAALEKRWEINTHISAGPDLNPNDVRAWLASPHRGPRTC